MRVIFLMQGEIARREDTACDVRQGAVSSQSVGAECCIHVDCLKESGMILRSFLLRKRGGTLIENRRITLFRRNARVANMKVYVLRAQCSMKVVRKLAM